MSREESLQSRLARHFAAPQRAAQLCSEWETGPVLGLIECSADPDEVLLALTRIVTAKPELATRLATHDRLAATVIAVLGASDALGLQLARYCDDLDLLEAPQLPSLAEVHHATTPDELRRAYQRAVLAIAAVDLTAAEPSASYPTIGGALAALADAVIETAICLAQSQCGVSELRLAAIAMGKTGAGELNYASDVDVIWVCDPLPGQSPQEAVAAASAVAAEVARICSAQTAAGTIWPVDANLRPEGKAGPLVRTVAAMDSYYSQWARPWEFQALLKARPMAGDRDVAQSFMELVRPRVWAVGDEPNFVGDTQAMRKRVVSLLTPLQRDRELKRAAGGLRDVEFTVQLLQLIHGRADSSLRCANTLDAIERLSAGGYIGRADARELDANYRTLRVLEHRVQLLKLRRTHLLPEAEPALRRLSRGLGADVLHTWRQTSRRVLRLHERLFYSPVLAAVAHVATAELSLTPEQAATRLASLGFADPRAALTHIEALTTGLSRKADIQRHLMPVMLGWFAAAPDPDVGLLAFRRTSEALGDSPWYLRALRDEAAMAENVATALASSRYVVDQLQRDPTALQLMIDPVGLALPTHEEVVARMRQAAHRQDQPEAAVRAVRELRRRELLRIAITELLGKADICDVGAAIAAVTSATITVAVELLGGAELLTVIAMGRWGGAEMSYGSDADVLFVADDVAAALPIVTSLRTLLAAPGIDTPLILDAGLRPEGKNGPLVRTPASYATYYATWSAPWEAQALLRARTICGDGAVLEKLDPVRYPAGGLSTVALAEMRSLKVRMETERMPRGVDPKLNLKFGPGGLVDVEWAAQLLQRRHAGAYEQLRSTSTLAVLRAGTELGLVDAHDAQILMDAWRLASRVRHAIMLSQGRASDQVPTSSRELARVAALLGYERGESSMFLNDYLKTMRRSRAIADRLLWD